MQRPCVTRLRLLVGPTFGQVHSSVAAAGSSFGQACHHPVEKISTRRGNFGFSSSCLRQNQRIPGKTLPIRPPLSSRTHPPYPATARALAPPLRRRRRLRLLLCSGAAALPPPVLISPYQGRRLEEAAPVSSPPLRSSSSPLPAPSAAGRRRR
jgi:hypothetical protein